VLFAGDSIRDILLVLAGHLKVTVSSADGREVVLDILAPGEVIGTLSIFDGEGSLGTISTLTAVELAAVPMPVFMDYLQDHPAVTMELLRWMTERVRQVSKHQLEFGTTDALGRVCARLVEMTGRYGRQAGGTITIDAPLSQSDIAGWAGLSREAVVKALASLRSLGWIRTSGRTITVVDAKALQARAESLAGPHR
jgi:CRP-like cAMP-binding protein